MLGGCEQGQWECVWTVTGLTACARLQVEHGCDTNSWSPGPEGGMFSMLHRAIILRDTQSAIFLIRNGADMNCPYRYPGGVYCAPPLHLACGLGLESVVQCLVDSRADVNQKVRGVGWASADVDQKVRGVGWASADVDQKVRGVGWASADVDQKVCGVGWASADVDQKVRGVGWASAHVNQKVRGVGWASADVCT